jgi:nucleoside-diphosphate-sugar epimerase
LKQISDSSKLLFQASLYPDDRILVTGASGWFGQTAIALLADTDLPTFFVGSSTRNVDVLGVTAQIRRMNINEIKAFEPTLVLDFAFQTREFIQEVGIQSYRLTNDALTRAALEIIELPTVRRAIVCSSGAAVYPVDAALVPYEANPYGHLKRRAEKQFEEFSISSGKNIICLRPWSVSGPQTTKPLSFAFSSFIEQARRSTQIKVDSEKQVFRRYTSVSDLIALGLAQTLKLDYPYGVLNSGGELVDLVTLANRISQLSGRAIEVVSEIENELPIDNYHSDGLSWKLACDLFSFESENLDSQILRSLKFQRKSFE